MSLAGAISLSSRLVQSAPAGVVGPPIPVVIPPLPLVTLDVPAKVLIGQKMKFKVTFDNVGDLVGYGPFVDIVLDAGGANVQLAKGGNCSCDGMTFDSANLLGVNGGPTQLTPVSPIPITATPCDNPLNMVSTTIPHPFAASGVLPVTVPPGGQLITLALPFGSFDPTQPPIEIEVTANVSNLADVGVPLKIYARGGFRYGEDALDNNDLPILSDAGTAAAWFVNGMTTPSLMIITKTYLGPEGENATGPNFIGFYPLKYKLTIDVAPGQTIKNVVLEDCLPNNMAFQGLDPLPTGASVITTPVIGQASPCLQTGWASLTGSASVFFNFFIPEKDANGNPVLPEDCTDATSIDTLQVTADWTPIDDFCDTPLLQFVTGPVTDTLLDKCIAIQKSVELATDTGASGFTPGDTLVYKLKFQISDFKTFGDLEVIDRLSDGQTLMGAPTLTVTDQFGTTTGAFIVGTDLLKTTSTDPSKQCGVITGITELRFKVSQKMISQAAALNLRHKAGILTGGFASTSKPTNAATGQIEFFAQIDDQFTFNQPGDEFVDKEDPINNCVDISGTVMTNLNPETPVPGPTNPLVIADDNSGKAIAIVGDDLKKTVYAVQRGLNFVCGPSGVTSSGLCKNFPDPPQEVRPGDQVTFRIEKTIPSSDAENLRIEDWLPLPIFDVANEFTNSSFTNSPCGIPAAGKSCLESGDTLNTIVAPTKPVFSIPAGTNSIKFDYMDFSSSANLPLKIDLLFTSTVTNEPFADQLFLTNEVQECENNTFGPVPCQIAIAQVNLREPKLEIKKGVVASDNPNGVFDPAINPSGVWKPFGASCPAFNGTITSSNIGALVNSNLNNVDASDSVTFAIAIENTGGSPAFEIELVDTIPLDALDQHSCFTPDFSGLCITDGSGTPIPFTTATASGGRTIITFAPGYSLAAGSPANTTGTNIAIITFNAQLLDKDHLKPGCCDNSAELLHYTSQTGGPDFVTGGFTPPFRDAATICFKPTLAKSIVATSEAHTTPQTAPPGTPPVVIGEIVRYRLEVRLPESSSPNFQITDALPAGMKFLNDGTASLAFISNGGITTIPVITTLPAIPSGAISVGPGCGAPVTFSLGDVQNGDNDPDLEYVVIEFNALVCNVAGNQDGTTLSNTFSVAVDNTTIAGSPSISVIVREPNLMIAKTVSPTIVVTGITVPYVVTITNSSLVEAFEVQFTDTLPSGLILDPGSVNVVGCFAPAVVNTVPSVTCAQIPVGGVVTITYKALADPATCPVTLTNNARVTWTSLPGPNGTTTNSSPMSTTPGGSGAPDGERNGVTPSLTLNDYAVSASAPLTVRCPPCTPAPSGMVAWYPGDGNANDIQGGNHGTMENGAMFAAGKVGQAFSFDLVNDHVLVPHHANQNTGSQITIDAWVNPIFAGFGGRVIAQKLSSSNAGGYKFEAFGVSGLQLQWTIWVGSTQHILLTPANVLTPTTFQHVAATYDGAIMRIYVNAAVVASMPVSGALDPVIGPFVIGRAVPIPGLHWRGRIDELELFNRALSQDEIQRIVNAGGGGKCKCPPINLIPAAGELPPGVVNIPYNQTFTATGGCSSSSFTYSITTGALPPGLTLSTNGVLSGTPKQPGVFTFTVTATDRCGCTRSQTYSLTVDCPMVPLPLFNTGVADDGSLLASGATDAHYVLNPSPVGPPAIVLGQSQIPNVWLDNDSSSKWIGPDVNPLGNSPVGDYTYRITFNMPAGADLSTAIIAGKWTSDNESGIFLNGFPKDIIGPNDFVDFKPFVITGDFMQGMNTLDFVVHNRGLETGLRVEMSGSVRCCPPPKADKCVITTSELHTMPANSNSGTPQVTIGEIVRYRLTATLSEGVSPSFRFTDHLPPGLTYLGNPKVAFVSTGGSGAISSSVPALSGAGLNLSATNVGACSGPTPTFVLPASQVTGGPFSSGSDPTFNLGNLNNTHGDSNVEYVIVEFNALVNNLPVNATGPPNQNGATLSNFYEVFVGSGTSTPIATSNPSNVTVVEPHLDVQKTVTTNPGTTEATFTVTVENTGTAAAFDVLMNDVLPAGFVLITVPGPSVSVSPVSCAQPALTIIRNNSLTITVPQMPVGCSVTLTFAVVIPSTCSPEPNIAQVTYTSLPGGSNNTPVGTQPNNTGSVTPGPTGADNGDRIYNVSAQASITGVGGGGIGCKPSCGCPLKISRFRENGPAGTGDEFVEIFNPSDSPVLVSECSEDPGGSSNGIGVFASAGNGIHPIFGQAANVSSLVCQIPGNTIIPGRGYYLCGGKDYSLGALGNNGGTSHSVPDQTISALGIPDDAGLALLNIGSNIVTQCVIGSAGCCTGFNYSDPGVGGTGSAAIYDRVGFRPYGPGSPMNVGPGHPMNIYPSLASQYCEGTCLQPVGDASTTTLGPGQSCPTTVGPAGTSFPVRPGGAIGATAVCYGESGQYEILRRQTTFSPSAGTLHRDTDNNPDDFILVSPNPTTGAVGQTVTGISGVTSVLGAAGPYNSKAPPDIPSIEFTRATYSPNVNAGGMFTLRFRYTNVSMKTVTGVRFKVDDLSTLCGNQAPIPGNSITGTADARNLSALPNCQGSGAFTAVLKALNSLTSPNVLDSFSVPHDLQGTVLEDLSVGSSAPGALSPFGGGIDNALVLVNDSATNPLDGDGITGGKGKFAVTIGPNGVLHVQFRFRIVKGGMFKLLITPMATTVP